MQGRSGRGSVAAHLRLAKRNADQTFDVVSCEEILAALPAGFSVVRLDCFQEKTFVELSDRDGKKFNLVRFVPARHFLEQLAKLSGGSASAGGGE